MGSYAQNLSETIRHMTLCRRKRALILKLIKYTDLSLYGRQKSIFHTPKKGK